MNKIKALNGKQLASAEKGTAGVVQPINRNEQNLEKQNIRTIMQTLHGCRKNCAECKADEAEWEPKIEQKEAKRAFNLYQKLQQIQSQTGQIAKSELNKFQNYRYFTEQQALNILKPLLAEQKMTLTFADDPNQISTEKPYKEWITEQFNKRIKKPIVKKTEELENQKEIINIFAKKSRIF